MYLGVKDCVGLHIRVLNWCRIRNKGIENGVGLEIRVLKIVLDWKLEYPFWFHIKDCLLLVYLV